MGLLSALTGFAETQDATLVYLQDGTYTARTSRETTIKHHDVSSIKFTSGASGEVAYHACIPYRASAKDAGTRVSAWFYFATLPTGGSVEILNLCTINGRSEVVIGLRLTTAGKLELHSAGNLVGATSMSALSTGTWYRICLAFDGSAFPDDFGAKAFVNGTLWCEKTMFDFLYNIGAVETWIGWMTASRGNNVAMYVQSIYIDDSTTMTDPGRIAVTHKKSTTNVANDFDSQLGSGAVNEQPSNDSNGWQMLTNATGRQSYNIEGRTDGDADLTGNTIIGFFGWMKFKLEDTSADGPGGLWPLVCNGTFDNAPPSPNVSAAVRATGVGKTQSTWPVDGQHNAGAYRYIGSNDDSTLLECGCNVAYIFVYKAAQDGALTMAGSLLKGRNFTGALTSAGALAHQATQTLAATLAEAGELTKQLSQAFTGTLTEAGELLRGLLFSGALTSAGALTKQAPQAFTGELVTAGALALLHIFNLAVAAMLTSAGALIPFVKLTEAGILTTAGALLKAITLTRFVFRGWVMMHGAVTKYLPRAFAGSFTGSGAMEVHRLLFLAGDAALTMAGAIISRAQLTLTGTGPIAGTLRWMLGRIFSGTLLESSTLRRWVGVASTGMLPEAGTLLPWLVALSRGGTLGSTGLIQRALTKRWVGVLRSTAYLSRLSVTGLRTGVLSTVGALSRKPGLSQSGSLAAVGELTRRASKQITARLRTGGTVLRLLGRLMTAALASVGALDPQKVGILQVAGVVALAGTLTQAGHVLFAGVPTFAGLLTRRMAVLQRGTLTLHGTVSRSILRTFSSVLSLTGRLGQRVTHLLGGAMSLAGAVRQTVQYPFSGMLPSSGSLLPWTVLLRKAGILHAGGSLVWWLPRAFTGALLIAGQLRKRPMFIFAATSMLGGSMIGLKSRALSGVRGAVSAVNRIRGAIYGR